MYKNYENFSSGPSPSPDELDDLTKNQLITQLQQRIDEINEMKRSIELDKELLRVSKNNAESLQTQVENYIAEKKASDDLIESLQKEMNKTNELDKEEICSKSNGYIKLQDHIKKMSDGDKFVPTDFVPKSDMQNMTFKLAKCNENTRIMQNSISEINNSNIFYKQRGFWIFILVLFLIGSGVFFVLTSTGSDSSDFGDF